MTALPPGGPRASNPGDEFLRSIRMRRSLSPPETPCALPAGFAFALVDEAAADDLHALLAAAYASGFGDVGEPGAWRDALFADPEYDPALVFTVRDSQGTLAAGALCWTSAFIKDFAVRADCRRRGLGQALMARVLAAFAARGEPHIDLKVIAANTPARALYARMGFVDVA